MTGKHARSSSTDDVLKHPSTKRAKEIDSHTPYETLTEQRDKHNAEPETVGNVLHWFRSKDLRAEDNKALRAASELVKKQKGQRGKSHLITCFVFSPKDMEWHGTSPARVDFTLETIRLLQSQLEEEMDIPLTVLTAEGRDDKVPTLLKFVKDNNVSHIFANLEYEVDELRRDVDVYKALGEKDNDGVRFDVFHDQTIVEPGTLTSASSGNPIKVFTPFHKAWLAEVSGDPDLLNPVGMPERNDKTAARKDLDGSLFGSEIPKVPENKQFASTKDRDRIRKLWPAGHAAARKRLDDFLKNKVAKYAATRSNPAANSSSRLSPYFSAGIISIRETLTAVKDDANDGNASFDSSSADAGVAAWVREIVFREFYRQTLLGSPHDGMNLPHNLKFDFVHWEEDEEGWEKWCKGTTGQPFIDAGMRQLAHEGWMHNRLRMNVSSYLSRSLLIDYRRGERFFAENLVDWDLANNTNGWEPSYTVFNPVSQAERNDPEGDYIRRWVPELKDVKGKAVFDPFHRLDKKEFEKLGYPEPVVDWAESKKRCMERYKSDMADVEP